MSTAIPEVPLGYRLFEGFLVLPATQDGATLTTATCPWCGKEHTHATPHVAIEGVCGLGWGHRAAHCERGAPDAARLAGGEVVYRSRGYYLVKAVDP